MIHFDLDERYQDELVVGTAISRREGVIYSIVAHGVLIALLLFLPGLAMFQPTAEELAEQAELLEREREAQRLVFVQPRLDVPAPRPPPDADLSDLDRQSQAPQVAEEPTNRLPFSLGNSPERAEAVEPEPEPAPAPEEPVAPPEPEPAPPEPERALAGVLPPEPPTPRPTPPRPDLGGRLGEALRNLDRYVEQETLDNPLGGARDPGASIQFDTKGIDFGPWLRRFVGQVRRNWFIPHAAMTFRGRVVLQFNIHRNGMITDLVVAEPSGIDAFNRAAYNAILGSNPTEPLPPDYPDPMAFFTVTFYYNENPSGRP